MISKLAGIPVIHSRFGMVNDLALIRIKIFMATILTEITAMKVSSGRKIKSNGVSKIPQLHSRSVRSHFRIAGSVLR
jgi:hypothetical protein